MQFGECKELCRHWECCFKGFLTMRKAMLLPPTLGQGGFASLCEFYGWISLSKSGSHLSKAWPLYTPEGLFSAGQRYKSLQWQQKTWCTRRISAAQVQIKSTEHIVLTLFSFFFFCCFGCFASPFASGTGMLWGRSMTALGKSWSTSSSWGSVRTPLCFSPLITGLLSFQLPNKVRLSWTNLALGNQGLNLSVWGKKTPLCVGSVLGVRRSSKDSVYVWNNLCSVLLVTVRGGVLGQMEFFLPQCCCYLCVFALSGREYSVICWEAGSVA